MNLWIDGRQVEAVPGERLLDAVRRLGLDHPELSRRPLAARIAGETFTLNYVPQREEQEDPAAMRRAMEASGGRITLLRYADSRGGRFTLGRCSLFCSWPFASSTRGPLPR